MIKKTRDLLFAEDRTIKERIFQIISYIGTIASLSIVLVYIIAGMDIAAVLTFVFAMFVFGVLSYVGIFYRSGIRRFSYIGVGLLNFFVFPCAFFTAGGVHGGALQWYVTGIIIVFLLTEGKGRIVMFVLTLSVIFSACLIALSYPELVIPVKNAETMYLAYGWSVIVVGLTAGTLLAFQNDTYEKENRKANEQKEEIEKLNHAQNRFFSNMSHEIRTPINTIIGLNEMILRENVPEEVAENAMNIQSASKMLLTLINDILDLSKIESGEMKIVPVQYETSLMFSEIVNMIWVRAHEKDLKFLVNISEELPTMLYGDEVRIKQVLVNLLTNAVKYTEKGTVTLEVRSERTATNRVRIHYTVSDTGIGIKKESISYLFDSFRRVDETKNRKIEGTGLGLSISLQLVQLMNGQISVDSIYTKGSTFHVVLEQRIVNPQPVGMLDFMVRRQAKIRSGYKQSFEASKARVLVVDDNDMNLIVVKKLLRDTSLQVDTARSGAECLEMTAKRYYHVILMDHMMPEMDGIDALLKIRSQENGLCRETPVVALTANAGSESREFYRKMGFQGYLAKPIHGALLEAAIVQYLPESLVEYAEESLIAIEDENLTVYGSKRLVSISTDCICDLPENLRHEYEIHVMPFYIRTKEGRFSDGPELDSSNLFQYMQRKPQDVMAECASVGEYEEFFANRLEEAEEVIHITSPNVGEGYERAVEAAKAFGNVHVISTGHISCGLGLMVLIAADMLKRGYPVMEICDRIGKYEDVVETVLLVGSTEQLHGDTRMGRLMRAAHKLFHMNPVYRISQGKMSFRGVRRGNHENMAADFVRKQFSAGRPVNKKILFITYFGCTVEELNQIKELVGKEAGFETVIVNKASATVASSMGLGAVCFNYLKNDVV